MTVQVGRSNGGRSNAARPPTRWYSITAGCVGCGACLRTCPAHAIRPGIDQPLVVLHPLCLDCGECLEVCPVDAIREAIR